MTRTELLLRRDALMSKLRARQGKPGYTFNCAVLTDEIARISDTLLRLTEAEMLLSMTENHDAAAQG